MKFTLPLIFSLFFVSQGFSQTTFSEQATAWGLNLSGSKDGGHSFADFDNDGDLDVLINTNTSSFDSRLYQNNGNGTYTDVTSTKAPDLLLNVRERSAVWGDLNNDGLLDFLRNTSEISSNTLEIYLQGSNGVFGDGLGGTTHITVGTNASDHVQISNGMNAEGAGMFDFDGDGDLDIFYDSHNYGVDLLRNNYIDHTTNAVVNPSATNLFTHATPGTTTILGLVQSQQLMEIMVLLLM